MLKPAPQIQTNRDFPTPNSGDVIFWELKDITGVCPPTVAAPAYGTAHPNTANFPDHQLCLIEPGDDQNVFQKWWYCKSRASQEAYNYSITYPYGGDTAYPRVTQIMILPRGDNRLDPGTEWAGTVFNGAIHYNQPSNDDEYLQPTPSTDTYVFPASSVQAPVLVGQSEEPLPYDSKISSLYVQVTRIYDIIPGSDDADPGSGESQADGGYKVERPFGNESFLRLTWKLTLPRIIADQNHSSTYEACPIAGYSSLSLVDEAITGVDETDQIANVVRIYEGNSSGTAFPATSSVTYFGKFYPGTLPPEKFIVTMRKVETVTEYGDSYEVDVASPSISPETSAAPLHDALASVEAKPRDMVRSQKVVTYYTAIEVKTLTGQTWDDNLLDYVPYETSVLPADEVEAPGGILETAPESGTERSITPLNTGWYIVTVERPRTHSLAAVTNAYVVPDTHSYYDTVNDYWPGVLNSFIFDTAPNGTSLYYDYFFDPEPYSGPCKALVQVGWSPSAPLYTFYNAEVFQPTGIRISWPDYISLSIPECLHYNPDVAADPAGSFMFDWPAAGITKYWLATPQIGNNNSTTSADWPNWYCKSVEATPYKGGFKLRRVTVFKPH